MQVRRRGEGQCRLFLLGGGRAGAGVGERGCRDVAPGARSGDRGCRQRGARPWRRAGNHNSVRSEHPRAKRRQKRRGRKHSLWPPAGGAGKLTHEDWQRWGTTSPLSAAVAVVVRELLEMEAASGEKMRFGGVGSKLKCDFKYVEDKKHMAVYETLANSDKKLQYYSLGRSVAVCSGAEDTFVRSAGYR